MLKAAVPTAASRRPDGAVPRRRSSRHGQPSTASRRAPPTAPAGQRRPRCHLQHRAGERGWDGARAGCEYGGRGGRWGGGGESPAGLQHPLQCLGVPPYSPVSPQSCAFMSLSISHPSVCPSIPMALCLMSPCCPHGAVPSCPSVPLGVRLRLCLNVLQYPPLFPWRLASWSPVVPMELCIHSCPAAFLSVPVPSGAVLRGPLLSP